MLYISIKPWDIKAPKVQEKSHVKPENLNVYLASNYFIFHFKTTVAIRNCILMCLILLLAFSAGF